MFHIHIKEDGRYGFKCVAQLDYKLFVRTLYQESNEELYSSQIVRNPKCIHFLPERAEYDGFVQRPREYLNDVIQLEYIKHPVYHIGEKVAVTLNWWKTQYYCSTGDLYITLQKDNVQIYNETISYGTTDDWTDVRYHSSTVYIDKALTTFQEIGTMLLTLYVPLWNSSEWLTRSATFIVKDPSKLYFRKSMENYTFYVGEKGRILDCDPEGVLEGLSFNWSKDYGDAVIHLPSTNKTLFFESVHAYTAGKYDCTIRSRLWKAGEAKTKHFFVTVPVKDNTITYFVIGAVVLFTLSLTAVFLGWLFLYNRQRIVVPLSDIKDFENGTEITDGTQQQMISKLPYNNKYEVKRRQIKIESSLLGSGEFGVVYRGGLVSMETLDTVDVAVKTIKRNADVAQIKSILNELKVLTYLDNRHPNVLNILGAYTSNLRFGEVLVCVELCEDSLLNILRKTREFSRTIYLARAESKIRLSQEEAHLYASEPNECSKEALMSWAYQIADGMQFLHINNVIHGDLAARNILISRNSLVKIADFGLGRVLENYKKYFKPEEATPLPWKWMAVEALVDRKFSPASDVWAFGITIWEIFSLGESPYFGLQWTGDFAEVLRNGLRLQRPEFSSAQLYELLTRCWDESPTSRPDFSKIKSEIASMLDYNTDYLNVSL